MSKKLLALQLLLPIFLFFDHCRAQDEPCMVHASQKLSNAIDDCRPNSTGKVCSEHGRCTCGVCECFYSADRKGIYYGRYCECDNFSCERVDGQLCSGNGQCNCKTCDCVPGWTGVACECSTSTAPCVDPENSEVLCNGQGECVCGQCRCRENESGKYSGRYCRTTVANATATGSN